MTANTPLVGSIASTMSVSISRASALSSLRQPFQVVVDREQGAGDRLQRDRDHHPLRVLGVDDVQGLLRQHGLIGRPLHVVHQATSFDLPVSESLRYSFATSFQPSILLRNSPTSRSSCSTRASRRWFSARSLSSRSIVAPLG